RAAHPRSRRRPRRARRDRAHEPAPRGSVGRSEGSPEPSRHEPLGRPAAAPVHRAHDRGESRGHPDGRAVLGARPHRDREDRGPHRRAAIDLRHRHRYALDAAGRARFAAHGVLPSRRSHRSGRDGSRLHESAPQADGRLHHRPLRLGRRVIEGHTSRSFDGALAALHMRVIEMGGLVLDQVREATVAYTEWDTASAERVIERERAVNDYDRSIDAEQLTLIARRQPMANDLRAIIAMSRAVAELERAGDEAKKIAQTVLRHSGRPGPATARDARHLARLAMSLLRLSLDAFDRVEPATASQIIAQDKDLDMEYTAGLRRLLTR